MTVRRAAAPARDRQAPADRFASDVEYYLAQEPRQLPSRYLYDDLGSALFEAICRLPWYTLTRTEAELLRRRAGDVFRAVGPLRTLLELGAGSGEKLADMLEAAGPPLPARTIHLVDISPSALAQASRTLAAAGDFRIVTHEATYERGLELFAAARGEGRALALFLGSNIGNFDPPAAEAFLRGVRASLRAGDALLLGTDLVKPERELLLAYDDPLGVTAAFNRNLLVRINRELDGDFDLDAFAHQAVWNAAESRVEMHLVSRGAQQVRIAGLDLDLAFADGESIWTESSYKFEPEQVRLLLKRSGFRIEEQWLDERRGFALALAEAE